MKSKGLIILAITIVVMVGFFTKVKHQGYSVMTDILPINKTLDFKILKKNTFKRLNLKIIKTIKEPLLIYSIEKSSSFINIDQTPQYYKADTISIPLTYFSNSKTGRIDEYIIIKGNFPKKEVKIQLVGNVVN